VTAVLSGGGNSVTYTPQGTGVAVDAGLGVSDAESATLAGATVAISAGFLAGDTLNFTDQNGIAGSYSASTGVLTLSGTASLANYQTALDSITYSFAPSNGVQTNGGSVASRTIDWVVNDGVASSAAATSTIETPYYVVHVPSSGGIAFNLEFVLVDGPTVKFEQDVYNAATLLSEAIHNQSTVNLKIGYEG
jgi:hypothetical protein